jgi:hypothetical protein
VLLLLPLPVMVWHCCCLLHCPNHRHQQMAKAPAAAAGGLAAAGWLTPVSAAAAALLPAAAPALHTANREQGSITAAQAWSAEVLGMSSRCSGTLLHTFQIWIEKQEQGSELTMMCTQYTPCNILACLLHANIPPTASQIKHVQASGTEAARRLAKLHGAALGAVNACKQNNPVHPVRSQLLQLPHHDKTSLHELQQEQPHLLGVQDGATKLTLQQLTASKSQQLKAATAQTEHCLTCSGCRME